MATKHPVIDSDFHFVVDPDTRNIDRQSTNKAYLMQYDKNSERFTFEVPLEIEGHDMSLCDVIQVHFENTSTGTSSSVRKTNRGVYVVRGDGENVHDDVKMDKEKGVITFSWLVDDDATQYAGVLKFQLKFICHDEEFEDVVLFKWHSNVNSDISIQAGLAYSADEMSPSTTATLQSLELVELETGVDVILDGVAYTVKHGNSGVYVGSGEMPDNCNVQIDPEGEGDMTQTIDENSTDDDIPSAKAVYKLFDTYSRQVNAILETLSNGEATT